MLCPLAHLQTSPVTSIPLCDQLTVLAILQKVSDVTVRFWRCNQSMFVLDTWRRGTHCAPTISGVNPLNLNLQEDAKIHHLLTTITVALPAGDKLIGGPVIINADPAQYPFDIIPNTTNMWDLVTTNSPKLDFETTSRYTLQLLVKDEKDSSASQTIIINILDVNEPPVFLGPLGEKGIYVFRSIYGKSVSASNDSLLKKTCIADGRLLQNAANSGQIFVVGA
ncbi:uncharacterized protein LOC122559260 [Chiloscyllium plagiosum]|uniref:uncharacterized protein LOC122559260 n=1 Tax=Chiloscyllium plagiosum TaxID=36176 RepID=UPI001CB7E396|nr:uncharacterized protein LOC122559260 [Chiloscyllium plagiosum]